MIYRALRDLSIGDKVIRTGQLFHSDRLKPDALEKLTQMEKVAPANLPPIMAISRVKHKKTQLLKIGVIDAGDFLEADDNALAVAMKISEAEVRQIKKEFYAGFATPQPRN